jgi:hypothetical protein
MNTLHALKKKNLVYFKCPNVNAYSFHGYFKCPNVNAYSLKTEYNPSFFNCGNTI